MEFYERRDAPFDGEILPPVSAAAFPKKRTEIQNFYAGKTILITGGSGFLGILLIEKLLRYCYLYFVFYHKERRDLSSRGF